MRVKVVYLKLKQEKENIFENHNIKIFLMILQLLINILEDKRSQAATDNCV